MTVPPSKTAVATNANNDLGLGRFMDNGLSVAKTVWITLPYVYWTVGESKPYTILPNEAQKGTQDAVPLAAEYPLDVGPRDFQRIEVQVVPTCLRLQIRL